MNARHIPGEVARSTTSRRLQSQSLRIILCAVINLSLCRELCSGKMYNVVYGSRLSSFDCQRGVW